MNRRDLLKSAAAAASGAFLSFHGLSSRAQSAGGAAGTTADNPIRILLPAPGTAGAAWRPLINQLRLNENPALNLDWLLSDPGAMQTQLTSGALDIGSFGSVGLATLANRGSDIVLFGAALNNHGRWLVKGDSPYKSPRDLIGKTISAPAQTSETYQQAQIAASLSGIDLKKEIKVIHGSPVANMALFERGDVDGILTLEPTASRLVARGAREIARVADLWNKGTGQTGAPFLVGLAAQRRWLDANHDTAVRIAAIFAKVNGAIRADPALLNGVTGALGLKPDETRAAALLPLRLTDSFATAWDNNVFAMIDKQIDVAVELGILAKRPANKIYVKL
jgi:ABC-type nitrate/sulfonate/bicarbonate transport system substrate-binding protein